MAKYPSIIIAGGQKCGTSALFNILQNHPGIKVATNFPANKFPPGPKELHFFNIENNFARGMGWYESFFENDSYPKMEATPEYVASYTSIQRMAQNLPDAKIILLMRDPVERAYSAWNHWSQSPENEVWPILNPDGDFDSNVREEINMLLRGKHPAGFVTRGFYIQQIEYLESFYNPDQIYLGFTYDLKRRHKTEIRKIQEFLEIEALPLKAINCHSRKYHIPDIPKQTKEFLKEIYAQFDDQLERRMGRKLPWRENNKGSKQLVNSKSPRGKTQKSSVTVTA